MCCPDIEELLRVTAWNLASHRGESKPFKNQSSVKHMISIASTPVINTTPTIFEINLYWIQFNFPQIFATKNFLPPRQSSRSLHPHFASLNFLAPKSPFPPSALCFPQNFHSHQLI